VMIWDVQGQLLAQEGARLLDRLPIFAEPISRAFVSEKTIPSAFFFLNLFLHVALPIGLGLVLWVHVTRVARPLLLPPKRLAWAVTLSLTALALLRPVVMEPRADLAMVHAQATLDLFYSFWLPAAMSLSPDVVWAITLVAWAIPALVPWWARPGGTARPAPSEVDERHCTGCEQCYLDCPYEAIAMLPRAGATGEMVARVDPALCVSCGLCTGSCAPMRVGPPARTGRDQLAQIRSFTAGKLVSPETVVLIACQRGAGGAAATGAFEGAMVFPVECVGNLHTSSIEYLIRSGVQGVLIVSCPPRDCWTREGVTWMEQRLYHDREAELQERVDRRRIRVVHAAAGERAEVVEALARFNEALRTIGQTEAEADVSVQRACDTALTPSGTP
jgi:coenzyme F420-reducing hydrogenase delta subunit/Pyruvate/2-oxoacid:ferredoxin oxidoreductase delta subunit